MDEEIDGYTVLFLMFGIVGIILFLLGFTAFAFSLHTMHTRDDITGVIVEHLNKQYELSDNNYFSQDSEIIVLDDNDGTMTFVMDETVFAADYRVEHSHFSENEITVKSVQQIKHEVNIGKGN